MSLQMAGMLCVKNRQMIDNRKNMPLSATGNIENIFFFEKSLAKWQKNCIFATYICCSASSVGLERRLDRAEVTGSNPVRNTIGIIQTSTGTGTSRACPRILFIATLFNVIITLLAVDSELS